MSARQNQPVLSRRSVILAGSGIGLALAVLGRLALRRSRSPDYAATETTSGWRRPQPTPTPSAAAPSEWSVPIGAYLTGPVEHRGRLFIYDSPSTGGNWSTYALDPATGATVWSVDTDLWIRDQVLFDSNVYVVAGGPTEADGFGGVLALDQSDGTQLWRNVLPVHAVASAAAGLLVVGDGLGGLYGIDPTTGRQIWLNPPPAGILPGMGVGRVLSAGDNAYATMTAGRGDLYDGYDEVNDLLVALEPSAGRILWRVDPNVTIAEWPIAEGSKIDWVSTETAGLVHVLRRAGIADWLLAYEPPPDSIAALDISTGDVVWRYHSYGIAQPLLSHGVLFVMSRGPGGRSIQIEALDPRNGDPLWSHVLDDEDARIIGDTRGDWHTMFSADEDVLSYQGIYGILSFDTSTGDKIWSKELLDGGPAVPLTLRGITHAGKTNPTQILRWQANTGREIAPLSVEGTAVAGFAAIGDVLYAMTDAALHAIPVLPAD